MTQSYLSDETIATMSADARRDLIQRLERPLSEVAPPYLARFRALRLGLMIGGSIALIRGSPILRSRCPKTMWHSAGRRHGWASTCWW